MSDIAAVVLTRNEEINVGTCLDSLAWADERVVFDQFSTDATVRIARERGATLIQHPFVNFAAQRNEALKQVKHEWVFFVDADERSDPTLAAEVREVVGGREVGWFVPRHNYIFGRQIRHGGWYPDYQMRLLKRGSARYDPSRPVHEVGLLDGKAGYLRSPLTHYNYATVSQFLRKQRQYVQLDATMRLERGERVRARTFLGQPLREFWSRCISQRGYLDGGHGLLLALLMAYYAWDRCRWMARLRRVSCLAG